ncbi:hypothetical protein [Lacticaseibacillus sp. GG6-2]
MKQILFASACGLLLLGLAGCGQTSNDAAKLSSVERDNASLKSEVSSLKTHDNDDDDYHDNDYHDDDHDTDPDDLTTTNVATYKLNQEALIGTSATHKAIGLTVTAADQKWNAFAKAQGDHIFQGKKDHAVQIQVKYTNYALDDDFQPDEDDLKVYDDDGNAATPLDYQDGQTEVTAGHSSTTTLWYLLAKPYDQADHFTIEFAPEGKALAKWTID